MKHFFKGLSGSPLIDYERGWFQWLIYELARPLKTKFAVELFELQIAWFVSTLKIVCATIYILTYPVIPFFISVYRFFVVRRKWERLGVKRLIEDAKGSR